VKQNHRPAWLLVAVGAALTAFCSVAVCTKATTFAAAHLEHSSIKELAAQVLHNSSASVERSQQTGDSVQLANTAYPRIAFASANLEAVVDELDEADRPIPMNGLCPANMASVDDRFCVDKYEASLIEMLPNGEERPFPYYKPVDGH
jgi:hypothetical protein